MALFTGAAVIGAGTAFFLNMIELLAYQTWTYYVFRRRVSRQEFQPPAAPSAPDGVHPEPATSPEAGPPPTRSGR